MAGSYTRFGGFGGSDDDYIRQFSNNRQSFDDVFGNDETMQALENSRQRTQQGITQLAGTALQGMGERAAALEYANAWKEQADAARRAAKKKQSGGLFGGLFNVAGTAASFIPGVGPLIGAGLKAVGGGFG